MSYSVDIQKISDEINKTLQGIYPYLDMDQPPENLDKLNNCIVNGRKKDFQEVLQKVFNTLIQNENSIIYEIQNAINTKIIGFHYISPSFGNWFRIINVEGKLYTELLKKETRPIEDDYFSQVFFSVLRDVNLLVFKELNKPIKIYFGVENDAVLCFPMGLWKRTKEILNDVNILSYIREIPEALNEEKLNKIEEFIGIRKTRKKIKLTRFLDELGKQILKNVTNYKAKILFKKYFLHLNNILSEDEKTEFISKLIKRNDASFISELEKVSKGQRIDSHNEEKSKQIRCWYHWLFRLFLLSFYYTIYIDKREITLEGLMVKILPVFWEPQNKNLSLNDIVKIGSIGIGYIPNNNQEQKEKIEYLECYLKIFMLRVLNQELISIKHNTQISLNTLHYEDIIRQCTRVDKNIWYYLNEYRNYFFDLFKNHRQNENEDKYSDKEVSKIVDEFLGANSGIVTLIKNIKECVWAIDEGKKALKAGVTIFLYSEPGCGKESLSKICHLLSPRSQKYSDTQRDIEEFLVGKHIENNRDEINKLKIDIPGTNYEEKRFFNYFMLNCGSLNLTNFDETLFGSIDKPGELFKTHSLRGTIFFDEINTMERISQTDY